ncbi:hypothetical protein SDC9_30524 [bioreactor metagenome]|uniref:Uncharacterized protein n=1 Tax=bioreactor metagenome TaxID=1076179 RepID=A0A644UZN9_9ZZZZ|nr:phage tail sheath subtilisin-like domain-containing protein [Methanobrevibacter sp.]MEA4957543.1 phage tail sheath subtilisin-like domain-containing protein [Methanobrevibacter sp.]
MIESRKMDITAEHKQEEISTIPGMAGTVAIIGNFERADPFTIIVAKSLSEAHIKLGDSSLYSGSRGLKYIFKPDVVNNIPGASKILAIQPGTRTKATLTLNFDEYELILETVSGGKWGNDIKISSTQGTSRDYQFIFDLKGEKKRFDNKTPQEITDKINSTNSYLNATLKPKTNNEFAEVLNQSLTGGTESASLTINDYTEALEFIVKEDIDVLILSDVVDDSFKPVLSEFLEDKKAKNNRSISLDSITPSDTNDSKIATVETARSSDTFYINQNIQVNDEELSQSDSIARIAGIIAGTKVNESLSKQTISDIQKVDPVLIDKEVDELTDKGIICFELINRENNDYGIYSAVSSCVDTNENGKKVPESEFHAVRSQIYIEKYFNKLLKETQGSTGIALSLLSANSIIKQGIQDLLKEKMVISLEAEAEEDPENSDGFLIKYNGLLNGIVNKIHNVYAWSME